MLKISSCKLVRISPVAGFPTTKTEKLTAERRSLTFMFVQQFTFLIVDGLHQFGQGESRNTRAHIHMWQPDPASTQHVFSPIEGLLDKLLGAGVHGGQDALIVGTFTDFRPEDLQDSGGRYLIGQLGWVVLRHGFSGDHCRCETARGKGDLLLGLRRG